MPPKKQVNPKGKFIIHSRDKELPEQSSKMYFVTIDPGVNNFAITILKHTKTKSRALFLKKFYIDDQRERYEQGTCSFRIERIAEIMSGIEHLLKKVDIVIIEEQMFNNAPMAIMSTNLINYFYYNYPDVCIISVSARLKSTIVDVDGKVSKSKFQKLEIQTALKLCEDRGDTYAVEVLKKYASSKEKKDKVHDLCVTINQEEALRRLLGYF